jgi:NADH:ubiquinone oxidoreductase subunit E
MNVLSPVDPAQSDEIDYMALDKIIEDQFDGDEENLIMILQAIQKHNNYLPRPALTYLSEKIGIPLSRIYSVGTFYRAFSLEPRGRNIVSICLGTACHVRGGEKVREKIEGNLNICKGETTADKRFTLESVRCIGCCSLGPVVKINEDIHARIASGEVETILDEYE